MNPYIPANRRDRIVYHTSYIFGLLLEAGAELKTCYTVALLFATGLERDMDTQPATQEGGV